MDVFTDTEMHIYVVSAVPDALKKEVKAVKQRFRRLSATHLYFKTNDDGSNTDVLSKVYTICIYNHVFCIQNHVL